MCTEAGRVDIFLQKVDLLERWLIDMDTEPTLRDCIVKFCRGRGYRRMAQCAPNTYTCQRMAASQDRIGWRRFMEGMPSRRMVEIQAEYFALRGRSWKLDKWATGLVVRLLEVTHGQWLYRNAVVHDRTSGHLALIRKEELAAKIEEQLLLGQGGLLESNQYFTGS